MTNPSSDLRVCPHCQRNWISGEEQCNCDKSSNEQLIRDAFETENPGAKGLLGTDSRYGGVFVQDAYDRFREGWHAAIRTHETTDDPINLMYECRNALALYYQHNDLYLKVWKWYQERQARGPAVEPIRAQASTATPTAIAALRNRQVTKHD